MMMIRRQKSFNCHQNANNAVANAMRTFRLKFCSALNHYLNKRQASEFDADASE
jgi:hypothetical protein